MSFPPVLIQKIWARYYLQPMKKNSYYSLLWKWAPKKIMARHYHVKSDRCQPKTKKDTSRKIHMVPRKKISKMSVAGWNFCDLDHLYQAYVNFTIG